MVSLIQNELLDWLISSCELIFGVIDCELNNMNYVNLIMLIYT